MNKVEKVCCHCQGTNVVKDAWAEWDKEKQEWVLSQVFDNAYCQDCESDTRLEDIPIASET